MTAHARIIALCAFLATWFEGRHGLVSSFSFYPPHGRKYLPSHLKLASSPEDQDFTHEEVEAMDKLIVDLSLDSDDDSRRSKVRSLFEEELQKPNGAPKRFTDLFDSVLITVGGRIQNEARSKSELLQQETSANLEIDDKPNAKTLDELQLWALVDMMVQTKTIVKKANGNLGNNGSFT